MRRINWEDEELRGYAVKCLTAAFNVRYNSIHCLANLVSGLALYHVNKQLNSTFKKKSDKYFKAWNSMDFFFSRISHQNSFLNIKT